MSCKNCGSFDHNKRTCKEPRRVAQERVGRSRQPRAPSSSLITSSAQSSMKHIMHRETGNRRQNYGAQVNTKSGSIYVRNLERVVCILWVVIVLTWHGMIKGLKADNLPFKAAKEGVNAHMRQ